MRHLLRCALVVYCLARQAVPLLAAAPAPQVILGGKPVSSSLPPAVIGGEVYVPLSFTYGTLPITADSDGDAILLRGPSNARARVPIRLYEGHIYYPLARACDGLQLGYRWMERDAKVYVAPRISSIRPDPEGRELSLRITTAYPVTYRVQALENPTRLMVEIPDAHLFAETTAISVDQVGVTQVRAVQYSYEPCSVRVFLDVQGPVRVRALSGRVTTQIRLSVSVTPGGKPAGTVSGAPPGSGIVPPGAAQVVAVDVEDDEEGSTRVVIRTTGPVKAQVARLHDPPRLALDIPNCVLQATEAAVVSQAAWLQGVRLGQYKDTVARVVVDLFQEVEYSLTEGPDPDTLVLNLRSALGLTPVAGKGLPGLRILIDPGHGGSLHGTTGLSGRREQDINLDVAKRLCKLLQGADARPTMTRWGDDTVSLNARPAMANSQGVQVFVSIHANSTGGRANTARGIETYYCWPHSLSLARSVHRSLVKGLEAPDRGVIKRPGLAVTRKTKMPSILVEIGYMNHREEDRLLGTPEYRQRVAQAIFNGIAQYAGDKGLQGKVENVESVDTPTETEEVVDEPAVSDLPGEEPE